MAELSRADFELIDSNGLDDWEDQQWERSEIVYVSFINYLQDKGLRETTAIKKSNLVSFFVMRFMFVYCDEVESILDANDYYIKSFLGNWYIRKFLNPSVAKINQFLIAIADFYTFAHKKGFIGKDHLLMIKAVCKDKTWFAERFKGYFDLDGEDFHDWLTDYDYNDL